MSGNEAPEGLPFSHLYTKKGKPERDSERARRRLYAFFQQIPDYHHKDIAAVLNRRCGIDVVVGGYMGTFYDFRRLFAEASIYDLLDSITWIIRVIEKPGGDQVTERWMAGVRSVFKEDNLSYRLDDKGGVHFSVDEEFERDRVSTLRAIQAPRYGSVAADFERAHKALDEVNPDLKGAVKSVFEATETLFRLVDGTPTPPRLGKDQLGSNLTPIVEARYAGDAPALDTAKHAVASFQEWVIAAHVYRHGQPVETPHQPPLELAVLLLSQGAGFLRWLAEIDTARQPKD